MKNGNEIEALKLINELKNNKNNSNTNLLEVEKLKTQLSNYQKIVNETESMLTTLEAHIKTEERHWRNEISLKDLEITKLKDQLENYDSSKTLQVTFLLFGFFFVSDFNRIKVDVLLFTHFSFLEWIALNESM